MMAVAESPRQDGLSRAAAMLGAVRGAGYAVVESWRVSPRMLAVTLVLSGLLAAVPALQVLAVSWLTRSLERGQPAGWQVAILALVVGLGAVGSSLLTLVHDRLALAQAVRQQDKLLAALTAISPQRLATLETNARIQASRSALRDISGHIFVVLQATQGVLAAGGVCAAVWSINPAAAVAISLALVPVLVVSSWRAHQQDLAWEPLGELTRRGDYAIEQLITARTGTELATLGSNKRIARLARTQQEKYNVVMLALYDKLTVGELLGGLATAGLLAAALVALLASDAGPAGVAGGVVGVLAGMSATAGAGLSLGVLVSDAPKITRFREFVESEHEEMQPPKPTLVHELRATHVRVTYPGSTRPALADLSITVRRGDIVALVGSNGAGKTTLVNALLGIADTEDGVITIDGRDAAAMTPAERVSYFGLLTQEFGRYELTLRDTVALGLPDGPIPDEAIWDALEAARIADLVRAMPDGLDTQLGQQWGGTGLSGGQWQRLALARIYLRDAPIWVLDEPTSAVDAESEALIFEELRRGKEHRITIVVSHRASTLRRMDHIYVLHDGELTESGTYADLIAAGGRFAQLFTEQAD